MIGGLAHVLSASSVLTCSFSASGPLGSTGCYTAPFNVIETVDLQTAYGTAGTPAYSPLTSGAWNYYTPGQGLLVSLTLPYNYSGDTQTLARFDNFVTYYDATAGYWKGAGSFGSPYYGYGIYQGMFDSQPNASAGTPGDHLIGSGAGLGAIEMDFARGISGVMFRISTPTTGDVNATISAYAVEHPTALDVPIMVYRINATNAAGVCASLNNGSHAPVPCNVAPWIGIEGGNNQIRSVIVSSADRSTYISNFYLDDTDTAPEPATFALFGSALMGLVVVAKRRAAR